MRILVLSKVHYLNKPIIARLIPKDKTVLLQVAKKAIDVAIVIWQCLRLDPARTVL